MLLLLPSVWRHRPCSQNGDAWLTNWHTCRDIRWEGRCRPAGMTCPWKGMADEPQLRPDKHHEKRPLACSLE